MRLNVRSPKRIKEEAAFRLEQEPWHQWKPIHEKPRSPLQPRFDSYTPDRATSSRGSSGQARRDAAPPTSTSRTRVATAKYSPPSSPQPSTTFFTDELEIHRDITRDSLVDNLLDSFDQLGSGPVASSTSSPSVPNFPGISSQPESSGQSYHTFNHQRSGSQPLTGFSQDTGAEERFKERFDPYAIRRTSIRRADSQALNLGRDARSPALDSEQRPQTQAGHRQDKKNGKSSSKNVDATGTMKAMTSSHQRGESRGSAKTRPSVENRRRSRTGPSSTSTSVLDRSRPVPAEYHDFGHSGPSINNYNTHPAPAEPINGRPTIFHRAPGEHGGESFKPQISTRNKVANLTGSDQVLAPSQPRFLSSSEAASRNPSLQTMNATKPIDGSVFTSTMRHQPSVESAKSKQGFFRRVFGSSKNSSLPLTTPTPQLPPLSNATLSSATSNSHLHSEVDSQRSASKASSTGFKPDMTPPPAPTRDQPQLIHKKSSFFRRRKRSEGKDIAFEDLSSPVGSSMARDPGTPSASSLRQAMDPFLVDGPASIISPAETTYFDTHEYQPENGTALGPTSGPDDSEAKMSMDGSTIKDDRTPRLDETNVTSFSGPAIVDRGRLPMRGPTFSSAADAETHSQGAPSQKTSLSNMIQRDDRSAPGWSSTRRAATTAQLTGRLVPESESPVDDWVTSTPFKRQTEVQALHKPNPQGLRPKPADQEFNAMKRERSPSAPDGIRDANVRPGLPQSLSSQTVPTVVLDSRDSAPIRPPSPDVQALAKKLFEEDIDPIGSGNAALMLGKQGKDGLRQAYMNLFDFSGINILLSMRDLCGRLALKGESQQVDRIISTFADRWCVCNPNHGFKSTDVVHTICYSILLLNTDLHVAEVEQKMTRPQFVKNTLSTVTDIVQSENGRPSTGSKRQSVRLMPSDSGCPSPSLDARQSVDDRLNVRSSIARPDSTLSPLASPGPFLARPAIPADLLLSSTFEGTIKGWESQVTTVLKEFYSSIRAQRLPLHGASDVQLSGDSSNNLTVNTGFLRRAGSVVSKTGSDSAQRSTDGRSAPTSWNNRNKSRQNIYHSSTFGSSTTSFEDSPVFSPSSSSTWSRSLGRAATGVSSDSLASAFTRAEYTLNSSVGFASALSSAIIREEEGSPVDGGEEDERDITSATLLEDESLGLEGAPWAKEGIVQHKHHLESGERRNKDRAWSQCFAVVERGRMRLFSFNTKTVGRSQRNKTLQSGAIVGGGNWMDNAEEIGTFNLRQTLANELPHPGYSPKRPHVFALMFPTGALHLFQVGTPEIAQEFVTTANYWAARLSREPLVGSVSNVEYGWSGSILSSTLLPRRSSALPDSDHGSVKVSPSSHLHSPTPSGSNMSSSMSMSRPSFSGSGRANSIDMGIRSRMPGDRVALSEWTPPQQSLGRSEHKESKQLEALRKYVADVEDELRAHGDIRGALLPAYGPRSANLNRALGNWERKSSYLLREVVRYRTYVDALIAAQVGRSRIYRERAERDERARALLEGLDV